YLQDVTNRLSGMNVHLRPLARIGAAADTILDVAREEAVSLILLSTRRQAKLTRLLFGSVSEWVVLHSRIPVLVIPAAATGEPSALPAEIRPVQNILVPLDGEETSLAILPHALEMARELNSRILLLRILSPH